MTLTISIRKAHEAHPDWNCRQLAELLNCDIKTLRGIAFRQKLPVPARAKAPNGQAKVRDRSKEVRKSKPVPVLVVKYEAIRPQANRVASRCSPTRSGYTRLL